MTQYSTPPIERQFSAEATLTRWVQVELAVLAAQQRHGETPREFLEEAGRHPVPSVADWRAETERCGHEFVAFLRAWGAEHAHIGLTSSDVIDTANAVLLREVTSYLVQGAVALRDALADLAVAEKPFNRVARTHGQPAVLDSAGHAWADLAFAMDRHQRRLQRVRQDVSVAKISGPSGSYHHIDREVESTVAVMLGLEPAKSATQIYARDSLGQWAAVLAGVVSTCEQVGMLIRLGSVVGEYTEGFGGRYEGSSAMPHKHNPSRSERLSGLGRLARAAVAPLMEGTVQWWERDLAHSSVERVLVRDLAGFCGYALELAAALVTTIRPDHDRMGANALAAMAATATHTALTRHQMDGMPYEAARQAARVAGAPVPGRPRVGVPNLDELYARLTRLGARPEEA